MGSVPDDVDPSSSTPKLSLYSLPSKPPPPPGSLTPPLHTVASIPFQWEEAPGKPRPTNATVPLPTTSSNYYKSRAARCLDLPPRLVLTESSTRVTNTPSPTTVLEGPYDQGGRSVSHTLSFSFGSGEDQASSKGRTSGKSSRERSLRFSSWRWGSFKDRRSGGASVGSFDFSSNSYGFEDDSKVKITRSVRRRSSFFLSFSNSSLVASIYGSLKQAKHLWKS